MALRITVVPCATESVHVPGQAIAPGAPVTDPVPVPAVVTVRGWSTANVAVTVLAASIETVHAPAPEHAPLHPVNAEPAEAAGVNVTVVP